jgi:hypothetical protein
MSVGPSPLRARSSALGDREAGQDVVAVHSHARQAEAGGPLVEGHAGLAFVGFGDRPLVVLAEEHKGGVVHRGEVQGLAHIALAGGAVPEIGDGGRFGAVHGHAHRVAGGVQRLRADHEGVEVEVVVRGVPATVADAPEHGEQGERIEFPAQGDRVVAVAGEHEVVVVQGAGRSDLGGLLAEQRGPQAQLPLPLERDPLAVDPPCAHHVPVETAQFLG